VRKQVRRAGLALVLLLLVVGPEARAQQVDLGAGPVLLLADEIRYDQEDAVVVAIGQVEITRGPRRLLAERVRYDQGADLVEASGDVTLIEPTGEVFFGEAVRLTGDFKDGIVRELRARLSDDSLFAAARGRRESGTKVIMDNAVYSPCRICPNSSLAPLWQLSAQQVTHDQTTRTISYRNAFFELFGAPVAYTPYFQHPDPTVERKSGFLSPSVGSDSQLGFTLETPYYFALAPNYDLTVAPLFATKEKPLLTAEWRHLLPNGSYDLAGSITNATGPIDRQGELPGDDQFRGHVEGEGLFSLGDRWRWGYDLEAASDDTFLQRYDFSNKSILNNRLFAERISGRNYVAVNGYGFQGLRPDDDQGLIPVVLPLAEAELSSDPLWWGSRLTLDSSVLLLTRTEGLDTRRFSATGGWELPWDGPIGDRWRLRLSLRGDLYQTDGDPETLGEDGSNVESRVVPRATLDWSWPLLAEGLGLSSVIEPVASATWTPNGLNDADIPNEDSVDLEFDDTNLFEADRFPGLDRVDAGAKISYGMRFSLFGEGDPWLSGLFGQSFRFEETGLFDPATGLDDTFSDYVGRVEFTPHPWMSARYRFRLAEDNLSLVRNELSGHVGPSRLRFDVNYLALEDDPEADEFREREEITAGVLVGVTPALSVRAQTRRDLERSRTVANNYGLVYRNPCLLLVAGLEQRFTDNRDASSRTTFTVRVTFQHLGELAADTRMFGL